MAPDVRSGMGSEAGPRSGVKPDFQVGGESPRITDPTARRFLLVLLAATAVLLALVLRPLAHALLLGAVLAGVLAPLHALLARRLGGRGALAAGIVVGAALLLVVGPLLGLGAFMLREGQAGVAFVAEAVRGQQVKEALARLPRWLATLLEAPVAQLADLPRLLERLSGDSTGRTWAALWAAAAATGSALFGALMMLIALYFLLVEGDELVEWLDASLPLRPGETRELLAEFRKASYSVVVSTIVTAGAQAALALVGYLVSGVPHPLFFGALTFVIAFVPALGAAAVCLFAAGLSFVTGHPYAAAFLGLWAAGVGLVDNVLQPLLIRAGMEMRGAVVFFALLGGLGAFGAPGLVIGPLTVAFFLALVRIYRRDYHPARSRRPSA